jgi:hypothetical protein
VFLLAPQLGFAAPDSVSLSVAVHREAGTLWSIAADGAAGQCTVAASTLHCPATGPVTFRYGPGEDFVLVGDTVLQPGQTGTAWVWAPERLRVAERERLAPEQVTAEEIRALFQRTGDHPVPVPSSGMFEDLLALVEHPDAHVRRELVDALVPYFRHTASDPFPAGSPQVVPADVLVALAQDEDHNVQRKLASRLRDLQAPGEPIAEVATELLLELSQSGGGVQRAAFASLASRSKDGATPAEQTWWAAMERVSTPGPPGRAAAGTLAALAKSLDPARVVPSDAVQLVSQHHLERTWQVWRAWRAHVPFEPVLAERLLRETVGLSPSLLKAWGAADPDGVYALITRWEPRSPHSDRYAAVVRALAAEGDPRWAELVVPGAEGIGSRPGDESGSPGADPGR